MSSSRIETKRVRGPIAALGLALALACAAAPAFATAAHSSPEDRQRFVSVTRALERAPLDPALAADRQWALAWLTDAPDIIVKICPDELGDLLTSKYEFGPEILLQDMFSMAVLLIEHPEAASDVDAQQMAGVAGALDAYRAILKDKPDARSPALDNLLQIQARGGLPGFVRAAWLSCAAKSKKK